MMALITLMSMLYAFVQQTAANRAQDQAEANLVLAYEARGQADKNASLAQDLAIELKNCKEGK
jgi:hypothetical protein